MAWVLLYLVNFLISKEAILAAASTLHPRALYLGYIRRPL